uniref:AT-rich interactive domain-containing protein 5B n=1 Tax=Cacopsylla melanoneura TaxID=428564 RepID=A0A8D8YD89_9HEMI
MAMCKLIGNPCATYGPYTFYKAFKYTKNDKVNILALGEFFFVKLWSDSDLVSIGELTLLWEDRNSEQTLAALRLYILPENTPDGRNDIHGEDEVLSITEKVVLRLEDLLTWLTEDADWNWGLGALWQGGGEVKKTATPTSLNSLNASSNIDFCDVEKEKEALGDEHWESNRGVIVLSFTRYCRYRGLLSRYEGVDSSKWIRSDDVIALGGFYVPYKNTKVLFCKDTFDYPDLEGHELLCNHLAPKYKGRTKKRKKLLLTHHPDTDSGSESSSTVSSSNKSPHKCGLRVRLKPSRKSPRTNESAHERDFLNKLYQYMKTRKTPIGKVPTIGFKELDLYKLFHKVKHLGGYEEVTVGRLWKYVFAEVGGEQGTTSSGTLSRKHYERLLLPYEKYLNGEVDKSSPAGGANHAKQSNYKDKTPGKNNNSSGKVNGYASIGGNGNKGKDLPRSPKESPVITLEESSNSSSNSNSNSNLTTCGNGTDKDKPSNFSMVKRKIVMEGNSSSLRNARLKLEKPQNGNGNNGDRDIIEIKPNSNEPVDIKPDIKTNGQVTPPQEKGQTSPPRDKGQTSPCREKGQMSPPRDKENIPVGNKPGDKRQAPPEVIDITDDTGPQSINAFKKQKLDILKYQGLEVTPVSSEDVKPPIAHPPPTLPPTPIVTPHVDFHQRERNKISITVTPDVSLLIKPQHSPTPPATPSTPKLFCNPPLSSNLFTPYQHGTKTVYGNPKEVLSNPKEVPTFPSPKEQVYNNPKDLFNTQKDIFNSSKETYNNSPKDVFNNPKDVFNNPKDLYNSTKDLYSQPKDIFNRPKELYNNPKDLFNDPKNLFNNSKDLYKTPKDIFNSQKDSLYNNPPKELLYGHPKKDLFSPSKSKDTFSPASTKDSFNNVNSLKDMFSPNNLKELLNNPSFRDMLGNPAFKDFFSNPTLKDMLNAPSSSPTPSKSNNYLSSPSKDTTPHYTPHSQSQSHHNRYNNSSLLHKPSPSCDDVLDLKVKPHPSLPPTLSATGQSLKRSTTQDEVLDLTVKNNPGKSNLEITLLPPTPSHRPYDMKRPLPVPLSRPSISPISNHSINKHTATSTSPSHHNKSNHSLNQQHQHHQHQHHQQPLPPITSKTKCKM